MNEQPSEGTNGNSATPSSHFLSSWPSPDSCPVLSSHVYCVLLIDLIFLLSSFQLTQILYYSSQKVSLEQLDSRKRV